jgi:hypothetical protein
MPLTLMIMMPMMVLRTVGQSKIVENTQVPELQELMDAISAENKKTERGGFEPPQRIYSTGRFSKPLSENANHQQSNDLGKDKSFAYSTAYSNILEKAEKQAQNLPDDLAQIAAAWPILPEHIKAAIKALVETAGNK